MILRTYQYKCGDCGEVYEGLEATGGYGEFLLRSQSGAFRYVIAYEDAVYPEVDELLSRDKRYSTLSESEQSDLLQNVFGVACDPDSAGSQFKISFPPPCPKCNSCRIGTFRSTDKIVDVNVSNVSHAEWSYLADRRKEDIITVALDEWFASHGAG